MNINEVITAIRGQVHAKQSDKPIPRTTQVVVRMLEEEFPIEVIQVEGPIREDDKRTVLVIRIDPADFEAMIESIVEENDQSEPQE